MFIFVIFLSAIVWVSSNPTYQRPPCPIHGNFNANQYGPIPVAISPYGPPASISPYSPPAYTSPSYQLNPPSCAASNDVSPLHQELGQMIVQKLFANPVFQSILKQNNAPYTNMPNVVNNYFIVPGDVLLNNSECIKPGGKVFGDNGQGFSKGPKVENVVITAENERNLVIPEELNRLTPENFIRHEHLNNVVENDRRNEVMRRRMNNHIHHEHIPHELLHPEVRQLYEARLRSRGLHSGSGKESHIPTNVHGFGVPLRENVVPSEEEVLKDFRSKFPNIPETIARNMLQQMRERVQRQYTNYRQNQKNQQRVLYQNRRGYAQRRKGKNRRTKPSNITQNAAKNNTKLIEVTPNSVSDIETTTNPTDTEHVPINKMETVENTTPFVIPELGSEDVLPNIDNGLDYDDYYPDFTIDNQAHVLGNIKPYVEPPNDRPLRKRNRKLKRPKHIQNEEVVYRSPPGLESPDFITTQVNRKYGNDFDFKSFSDRNLRTTFERYEDRPVIETDFAGSKVMNYGAKDSEEMTTNKNKYYVDDDKVEVSGPSIVIAKSYAYPDYEW